MTDERLTPTEAHEQLDRAGLLDTARSPGCYALRLSVPDDRERIARDWLARFESEPNGSELDDLAAARRVAYVGASKSPYDRIADHAEGEVRKARYMEVFPPVEVVDVWPASDPFRAEYNRALSVAREGWTVVCDGSVLVR